MGKRSDFERVPRDYYPTPYNAVEPLLPHLPETFTFAEPCAGDRRLIEHLQKNGGHCNNAMDIEPQHKKITKGNCLEHSFFRSDYIITNPPWNRKILHPMIDHFSDQRPTWLLFDSDWMHTKQSIPYLKILKKVVSIGRVKWIEGSASVGKDNCCWYLFENTFEFNSIKFYGRT